MAIQIPGARLIEEIIASLPTNSKQAIDLRDLASQIEVLKKENEDLKAQLAKTKKPDEISAQAVKILKILFDDGSVIYLDDLIKRAKLKKGIVIHHLGTLAKLNYIRLGNDMIGIQHYRISHDGSTFLMQNIGA